MQINTIVNTLFSFKDERGYDLFRKASYESLVKFLHSDTTTIELGWNVLLFVDGEYKEYSIDSIQVHVLRTEIPTYDAIPYSYHIHVNVRRFLR
jgi:hypothetical protein